MSERKLYILGALVILTGVLGIIAGIIAGTPGSIVIGTGLVICSVWMLTQLQREHRK